MDNTREWLKEVTDGASMRSVADRLGEYNVTFTRRIDAGDAHTISAVAKAYGVSPIPGLLAAEIITEQDLSAYQHEVGLDSYDDLELAEEMVKRIQERPSSSLATVTEFPNTPDVTTPEQGEAEETTPSVRDADQDLEEALRDANAMRGAAQHRTPRLEEPDEP